MSNGLLTYQDMAQRLMSSLVQAPQQSPSVVSQVLPTVQPIQPAIDIAGLFAGSGMSPLERQALMQREGEALATNVGQLGSAAAYYAPQRAAAMQRGVARAAGRDTRAPEAIAAEEIGKLDLSNISQQAQALRIMSAVNPQGALGMKQFFEQRNLQTQEANRQQQLLQNRKMAARQSLFAAELDDATRQNALSVINADLTGEKINDVLNTVLEYTPPTTSKWENIRELPNGNIVGQNPLSGEFDIVPQSPSLIAERENIVLPEGDSESAQLERIRLMQDVLKMSEEEATKFELTKRWTDPVTGNTLESVPGQPLRVVTLGQDMPSPTIASPRASTQEDFGFDVGQGTGVWASIRHLYTSTISNAVPVFPPALGTETAAQNLRLIQQELVRAMSISNRPPVIEREMIANLAPTPLNWAENPEAARAKARELTDVLLEQYIDDLLYSTNQTNPAGLRESSAERMAATRRLTGYMLTPEAQQELFGFVDQQVEAKLMLPRMTTEELRSLTPEELRNMSDESLDFIRQRLSQEVQ